MLAEAAFLFAAKCANGFPCGWFTIPTILDALRRYRSISPARVMMILAMHTAQIRT